MGALSLAWLAGSASAGHAASPGRDGRIAFDWNANTRVAPQSCVDIFSIRPNGSDRQRLTPGCPWSYSDPAYSPSGEQIVFARHHEPFPRHRGGAGIYVMDADGSHVRRITASSSDEEPAISPNGKWIVFDRYVRRTGRGQLFLASFGGFGVRQLTHGQGAADATFSPDGLQIAFVGAHSDIYTMRLNGSHLRQLTHVSRPFDWFYGDPDFSPGGRRIVSVCGEGDGLGSVEQVCTMRADGTHIHHLTPVGRTGFTVSEAVFSPDGRRIAFIAVKACGRPGCNESAFVYTMRTNGSHIREIYDLGAHQGDVSLGLTWQALP